MARHPIPIVLALGVSLLGPIGSPAGGAAPGWAYQRSPTSNSLADVSCSSPTQCMAVGANATIITTTNGGKTWNGVSSAHGTAHPTVPFTSVRCPVSGVCSIVAPPNVVLRTNNGGRTWSAHTFRLSSQLSSLGRLACPARPVCFVTASPSGYPTTWFNHSAAIFKTTNGGASWTQLSIPPRVQCPGSCGPQALIGYDLQWISCQSAQSCRAGGNTFIGSHQGYAGGVIRTGNGGATWTLADSGFAPNIGTCPIATVCTGIFYQPRTPNTNVYFDRSTNAGATWSTESIATAFSAIACTGQSVCELAGPKGRLAMAVNSRVSLQPSPGPIHVAAIACPSRNACYAVGAGGFIVALKR